MLMMFGAYMTATMQAAIAAQRAKLRFVHTVIIVSLAPVPKLLKQESVN